MEFAAMQPDPPPRNRDRRHHDDPTSRTGGSFGAFEDVLDDYVAPAFASIMRDTAAPVRQDVPGVMGIALSVVGTLFLVFAIWNRGVIGWFFCGAIPFTILGAGLSFCGTSIARPIGLALNVIQLAIAMLCTLLSGTGVFMRMNGIPDYRR